MHAPCAASVLQTPRLWGNTNDFTRARSLMNAKHVGNVSRFHLTCVFIQEPIQGPNLPCAKPVENSFPKRAIGTLITEYTLEKSRIRASIVVNVSLIQKLANGTNKYTLDWNLMNAHNVASVLPEQGTLVYTKEHIQERNLIPVNSVARILHLEATYVRIKKLILEWNRTNVTSVASALVKHTICRNINRHTQ